MCNINSTNNIEEFHPNDHVLERNQKYMGMGCSTTMRIQKIINLSQKSLTPIQILSKGLKFTETPQKPNVVEIKNESSDFCKRLRLAEQFF